MASDSVFKNLLKRAPAKEVNAPRPHIPSYPNGMQSNNSCCREIITNPSKLMALSKQSLNYTTDKSKIGRREMVPNVVNMKCIDFFVLKIIAYQKLCLLKYNKFVADLKAASQDALASKSNEKLMNIARFACAFV